MYKMLINFYLVAFVALISIMIMLRVCLFLWDLIMGDSLRDTIGQSCGQ